MKFHTEIAMKFRVGVREKSKWIFGWNFTMNFHVNLHEVSWNFTIFPTQVPTWIQNMTSFSTLWTSNKQNGNKWSSFVGMSQETPSEILKSYLSLPNDQKKCARCSWISSPNAMRLEEPRVKRHAEAMPSSDETQLVEASTHLREPNRLINCPPWSFIHQMEQDRAPKWLVFLLASRTDGATVYNKNHSKNFINHSGVRGT